MRLLIDNQDGAGLQDYSAYLDSGKLPKVERKLNRAETLQAWLVAAGASFAKPVRGARVVLQREDGYKLFTGYLTAAAEQEYVGAMQSGAAWRYSLMAVDDSWLLERNAPTSRIPFVERTAGDVLRTLTSDVLPGVLDVSGVQELGLVREIEVSSQRTWSEHAQALATRERACYRVHDGKVSFQAVGQQMFAIDEGDARFDPKGLTLQMPDRLGNDITVLGEDEPTTYVRDYFLGDNVTLGFYLSRSPFARDTVTVFEEEYGSAGLSPTLWQVADPAGKVSVANGQLRLGGGPATVQAAERFELAGGLRFQHGQVTFSAASTGTLGGIYSGSVSDANCVAGFRVTPSGGNCLLQALVNGAAVSTTMTTQAGHEYGLSTQLYVSESQRTRETYCSSAHTGGCGRGGETIAAAMRVVLSVHDVDPNSPGTVALPGTVLYDGVLATPPGYATYAVANGTDLHVQVAYTRLQQVADVEVRSMIPGQGFRTRLTGALADGGECYISTAGELHFYPPYPPQAYEQIVVSYRGSGRAMARVQDTASIAAHQAGADRGRRGRVCHLQLPAATSSLDCETAALAMLDDAVAQAYAGTYRIGSDSLAASDVLPGDAVQVTAPSRGANFGAIVRVVAVQVTSAALDRLDYTIRFANDAAEGLSYKASEATVAEPLPTAFTSAAPSSSLYLAALTAVQVTDVIATEITVDAGTAPPSGGGFEVRRSDGGWGPSGDGNLVGRYTTQTMVLPRLSRIQEYVLRQYDNSSPAKYSRQSALVHLGYPL